MDLIEIVSLTGVLLELSLERAISGVSVTLEVRVVTELPPGKNLMRTAPAVPKATPSPAAWHQVHTSSLC